jgi:phospholipid/cholesterol/gamma-HCH transport system substrate-binding protein
MKFSIRYAEKIVGAFILIALVVIVVVIFMLGSGQRWFARDVQYRTYFNSASGLSANMAVQYKGFTIGHVKKFSLTDENIVETIFVIFEKHSHRVKEGSIVELVVNPIGLGNSFIFHPGRGAELLPENSVLPEYNSPLAKILIASGMVELPGTSSDAISEIFNKVEDVLSQANELLDTLNFSITGANKDDPVLAQIINSVNDTVFTVSVMLNPILGNIDFIADKLSDPSGTVMSILDSDNIYSDLSSSLDSISGILDNIDKTSNLLPSQIPGLLADLTEALRTAHDVMTALTNNPLLRRGIPERTETSPGGTNPRNLEF